MIERPHIVILSRAGSGWVGGLQYTINLVEALIDYRAKYQASNYDVSVVMSEASQRSAFAHLAGRLRTLATVEEVMQGASPGNRLRWWLARRNGSALPWLEEAMKRMGASFVYPFRSRRVRSAEWIPDFQYRHFPEGSNPIEVAERKQDFANCIEYADQIVLSSAHAARDCVELFPDSQGRTHVLRFRVSVPEKWLAQDPQETVRHYNLPERFLLVSNLLAPTKNHTLVLQSLAKLSAEKRPHVVFTGDILDWRNPGFYNAFLASIHELGIHQSVSLLGLIPKVKQMQLLRASVAYLQASLFEGWHTGVEEAHVLGKAIILSDIPVHREQSPPRAEWFDPNDADALALKMADVVAYPSTGFEVEAERRSLESYAGLRSDFAEQFLRIAGIPSSEAG